MTIATALPSLLGLFLTVAAAPSAGAEPPPPAVPPFQFHESTLDLGWTDKGPQGSATVVNNTLDALTLHVTLSPLGLEQDGHPVENAAALRLTAGRTPVALDGTGTLELPAAGSVALRLEGTGSARPAEKPPVGKPFLAVSEARTRWVARIPLGPAASATAGAPAPTVEKALVEKATITLVRYPLLLGLQTCRNCRVPISSGSSSFLKGTVGHLTNEKGGIARIEAVEIESGAPPSMSLSPHAKPGPGTYKGKIDLLKDEKTGEVELTLLVQHDLSLPLVTLVASVYLGLITKRFLVSGRAIGSFRAREAALDTASASSQAAFERDANGHPYAGMSLETALAAARRAVLTELDEAEAANESLNPDGARYQAVAKELTAIESALRSWAVLPAKLAALESAAVEAEREAQAWVALAGALGSSPPRVLDEAGRVLAPKALDTLEGVGELARNVEETRKLVRGWLERADVLKDLRTVLDERLGQASPPTSVVEVLRDGSSSPRVVEACTALQGSVRDLWSARTSAAVSAIDTKLTDVAAKVDEIAGKDRQDTAARIVAVHPARASVASARQIHYQKALLRWDSGVAVLAFLIAVATGLRDLYFDQPFGTVKDYVSLALVGLTARLAVDLVGAALDRLAVRRY